MKRKKSPPRSLPPRTPISYDIDRLVWDHQQPDDPYITAEYILDWKEYFKQYTGHCVRGSKPFMFIKLFLRYGIEELKAKNLHFPLLFSIDQIECQLVFCFDSDIYLTQMSLLRFVLYAIQKPSDMHSNETLKRRTEEVNYLLRCQKTATSLSPHTLASLPLPVPSYYLKWQEAHAAIEFATRLNDLRLKVKLAQECGDISQKKQHLPNIINCIKNLFAQETKQLEFIAQGKAATANPQIQAAFARLFSPLPFMWFYLEEARYFWHELFDCIFLEKEEKNAPNFSAKRAFHQEFLSKPLTMLQRPTQAGNECTINDYVMLWQNLNLSKQELSDYQKLITSFFHTWQLMEKEKDFCYWQDYLPEKEFFAQLELEWCVCDILKKNTAPESLLSTLSKSHPLPDILKNRRNMYNLTSAPKPPTSLWDYLPWTTSPTPDIFANYQIPPAPHSEASL